MYLHRTIVADVVVVGLSEIFRDFVLDDAFCESTADFVGCSPNHGSVMANEGQVVLRTAVSEIVPFQPPRFYSEKPTVEKMARFKNEQVGRYY